MLDAPSDIIYIIFLGFKLWYLNKPSNYLNNSIAFVYAVGNKVRRSLVYYFFYSQ